MVICWVAALGLLAGCVQSSDPILPHTYRIYPITEGQSSIYYVLDSTFSTTSAVVDEYFRKVEISGTEIDLTGRETHKINLYRSNIALGNNYDFAFDRLWTRYLEPSPNRNYFAEQTEENQRIVKLQFPVYPDVAWNGNLYNNLGTQVYRYTNVDSAVIVQGKIYDNCVMVLQRLDTTSAIFKRFSYEIYAPDIGLIKKYDRVKVYDGAQGQFNPSKSRVFLQELVQHN